MSGIKNRASRLNERNALLGLLSYRWYGSSPAFKFCGQAIYFPLYMILSGKN